jgi:hypothetical protein
VWIELVAPGVVGALLGVVLGTGAGDRLVDALQTPVVRLQPALDTSTVVTAVAVVIGIDILVTLLLGARKSKGPTPGTGGAGAGLAPS